MEPELIDDDDFYEFDEFSEFDDDDDFEDDDDDFYEYDDDDLFDEDDDDDGFAMEGDDIERRSRRSRRRARRKARRRGPKTGKGRGYMQKQLRGYVKRTELRKSLARVGRDVKRNAAGIKSTARSLSSTNSRVSSTQRINRAQSKEIAKIKADMAQQQQMQMLLSLIDRGAKNYRIQGTFDPANDRNITLDEQEDSLTTLLPLLMSGSSMGGSSDGGMFGNPLMLLALTGAFK